MKTLTFVAIVLFSGAVAGTVLGVVNQGVVEPFIDRAIEIEVKSAEANGEIVDPAELAEYRLWQKGGEIVAGTILGLSIGALFGIVFAYARASLPGSSNKKKALALAGIMWFVLFLVPAIKYPANPPAVGDPDTIYYRQSLYVAFVAISGLSALGLAFLRKKMGLRSLAAEKKKAAAPVVVIIVIYAAIMAAAFVVMPPNPDEITAPMDLVAGFRVASALTMSLFWALAGIILGSFWDRLRPHESAKIKAF